MSEDDNSPSPLYLNDGFFIKNDGFVFKNNEFVFKWCICLIENTASDDYSPAPFAQGAVEVCTIIVNGLCIQNSDFCI